MTFLLTLAALQAIAAPAPVPAIAADADNAAINAMYDRLTHARETDFAAIADSFHPQGLFVFLDPQGPGPAVSGDQLPARARQLAERIRASGAAMSTGYRVERRSVIGDIAVDTGYSRGTRTISGSSRSTYSRFLVTLKREDGIWRILSDAAWPADEAAYRAVPRVDGLKYDD